MQTWTPARTSGRLGVVLYEMVAGRPPFTGSSRSDVLVGDSGTASRATRSISVAAPVESRTHRRQGTAQRPRSAISGHQGPAARSRGGARRACSTSAWRLGTSSKPLGETRVASRRGCQRRPRCRGGYGGAALCADHRRGDVVRTRSHPVPPTNCAVRPPTHVTFGPGCRRTHVLSRWSSSSRMHPTGQAISTSGCSPCRRGSEPIQVTRSPAQDTATELVARRYHDSRSDRRGHGERPVFRAGVWRDPSNASRPFGSHPMWSAMGPRSCSLSVCSRGAASDNYVQLDG